MQNYFTKDELDMLVSVVDGIDKKYSEYVVDLNMTDAYFLENFSRVKRIKAKLTKLAEEQSKGAKQEFEL